MRSTIAAIGAALTFSASPASALGVLAYGDEPVGDPGAIVQDLISTEFERFFSAAGTVLVIHYDTVQLGMDRVCHATVGISAGTRGRSHRTASRLAFQRDPLDPEPWEC
ncbi:hypothetical protein [Cupriavidus sp. CuC1]|uniref:hypothetical protein n=1 Tax=Cupriavidus sp. CuC1 TaxID=3373131 RepID=UPI0037D7E03F